MTGMPKRRRAAILFLCILAIGCTTAGGSIQELPAFWNDFRTAALAEDIGRVAELTRFPLEVRGPDDSDPVVTRDRNGFAATFKQVLSQDSGARAERETVKQFLERTRELPRNARSGESLARVGNFVFRRIDNRWLLVRIYLAETR